MKDFHKSKIMLPQEKNEISDLIELNLIYNKIYISQGE